VKRTLLVALALAVVAGAAVLVLAPRGRAQVQITLEPSMTKGAAESRVTIVEFSDYQ
jgi:hypothetical protein